MTNEQVIKRINEIREILADYRELTSYDHEALDIAISALSKQCSSSEQADQRGNNTEMVDQFRDDTKKTDDVLINLPSAQPETNCSEIPNDSDTISRQAAIEVLRNRWLKTRNYDGTGEDIAEECEIYLKTLPSAQPEQRWIPTKVKPDPDLPEDDMSGYFLVTLHTYGNIGFDMDEYEVKKMRWDRVNGWVFPVHSPAWIEEALTQEVLAWKPCPEPYREDGVE